MAALPEKARVVIIGQGGFVGASGALHLGQNGWDGSVGLVRSARPPGGGATEATAPPGGPRPPGGSASLCSALKTGH